MYVRILAIFQNNKIIYMYYFFSFFNQWIMPMVGFSTKKIIVFQLVTIEF